MFKSYLHQTLIQKLFGRICATNLDTVRLSRMYTSYDIGGLISVINLKIARYVPSPVSFLTYRILLSKFSNILDSAENNQIKLLHKDLNTITRWMKLRTKRALKLSPSFPLQILSATALKRHHATLSGHAISFTELFVNHICDHLQTVASRVPSTSNP